MNTHEKLHLPKQKTETSTRFPQQSILYQPLGQIGYRELPKELQYNLESLQEALGSNTVIFKTSFD